MEQQILGLQGLFVGKSAVLSGLSCVLYVMHVLLPCPLLFVVLGRAPMWLTPLPTGPAALIGCHKGKPHQRACSGLGVVREGSGCG